MLDLEAIEYIKQLKARYFRFVDTRDLEGLRSVFTDDATAHFKGADYEFELNGWEALEAFYKKSFTPATFGMHNGHHPEITVNGDTATRIWSQQDNYVELKHQLTILGSALYDDAYRKESGEWKIARTGYKRLWEEYHPRGDDIKLRLKPIPDADAS
ncbi:MAG: nuclear transport factor 2 family protein [Halieaceae bacterium]